MSEVIIYPALFTTLAFVFWVLVSAIQRRSRLKMLMAFRLRLLDRLTSAADIATVLSSEDGARLLSDGEEYSWAVFQGRVAQSAQVGVLVAFIAAGFATLAWLDSFEAREELTALAVMAGFVGAGFLTSALVAWRLGIRAGLAPPQRPRETGVSAEG